MAPLLLTVVAIAAFLVTRLLVLDADVPDWTLAQYSAIDEFAYAGPAFNLVHYGTWVHQAAPWTAIEGLPLNVAQNVVAAATLQLVGLTYWGLRASSIVFGLVVFVAMLAFVRRQADDARRLDGVPARLAFAVCVAAGLLLLVDFSSLLSARIVEPTITRLAAGTVILYLVGRGTFLGDRQGLARSAAFGALVMVGTIFVYVYNAFLLPAAFVALCWWAVRAGDRASAVRHAGAFIAGAVGIAVLYFVLVLIVYGQTPIDWYRTWIGSFSSGARVSGLALDKALSILDANIFRVDPAFRGLFLVSLPVFAWTLVRRPNASAILVAAALLFFLAQSAYIADYPERKFLMAMLLALPIVAWGILGWGAFREWVLADRRRLAAFGAWVAGALLATLVMTPLSVVPPHGAMLARLVLVGGITGVAALALLVVARRQVVIVIASAVLAAAIVVPLLYVDIAFVYRRPTFTYRDTLIEVGPTINGQATAGGLSFGMQLYNTSRPTLSGYFFGMTQAEYEADLVRMFTDRLATSMFSYVDPKTRDHLESLGFEVVDTYRILLPHGQRLGRYVFAPTGSP